jgi:enterochelin esterase-like enzyme
MLGARESSSRQSEGASTAPSYRGRERPRTPGEGSPRSSSAPAALEAAGYSAGAVSSADRLVDRARTEHAPVIAGDQATFVWLGERAPDLAGDMTGWRPWQATSGDRQMEEIAPGIWTHSVALPPDAYIEYAYFLDGKRQHDPLNPRRVPNGFGETNNFFAMPDAPQSLLFRRQRGVKAGQVTRTVLQSPRLAGERRTVRLYRPAVDGLCLLLLVLDGQDYWQRARLAVLADNLIHRGVLPPLAIVFLDNARQARFAEYGCSEALVWFVAEQLVPWVAGQLPLLPGAGHHGVLGASMGGLSALWLGVRLPDIFGRVFSQAGGFALGLTGELGVTRILRWGPRLPLRVYMDCGRFDPLVAANRTMHALLSERGYEVTYREYNAGHNYPAWREGLAAGLEWLFGSRASGGTPDGLDS